MCWDLSSLTCWHRPRLGLLFLVSSSLSLERLSSLLHIGEMTVRAPSTSLPCPYSQHPGCLSGWPHIQSAYPLFFPSLLENTCSISVSTMLQVCLYLTSLTFTHCLEFYLKLPCHYRLAWQPCLLPGEPSLLFLLRYWICWLSSQLYLLHGAICPCYILTVILFRWKKAATEQRNEWKKWQKDWKRNIQEWQSRNKIHVLREGVWHSGENLSTIPEAKRRNYEKKLKRLFWLN